MAIIKNKILDNGTSGDYWVAQVQAQMIYKKTSIVMLLFKDKEARDNGKHFMESLNFGYIDGIYLTGEQVYSEVKKSNMIEISPAVEAQDEILDEEGNVVKEAIAAQDAILEESNWFADAVDDQ